MKKVLSILLAAMLLLGIVPAPVSYTHLDVYKRQAHSRHRAISRENSFFIE